MKANCSRAARAECLFRALPRSYRKPIVTRAAHSVAGRAFHTGSVLRVIKPFLLADIGEGIREVQIIQWFVQPGARVEQFDKLCEVSSDKATVEITSRFDGIIKKLHYEADDMAIVGKPLVDIDIQSEISPEDEALTKLPDNSENVEPATDASRAELERNDSEASDKSPPNKSQPTIVSSKSTVGDFSTLATPAVRHAAKQYGIELSSVTGTGKDGRILKEDVCNHVSPRETTSTPASEIKTPTSRAKPQLSTTILEGAPLMQDRTEPLTPTQIAMFKTMTASLSIPHFLYSSTVDLTALTSLRRSLNRSTAINSNSSTSTPPSQKLTFLPFLLKALSLALLDHPIINARLDINNGSSKPNLQYRASHNIGIAVDTPSGLVVPVIHSAHSHSITSLASRITELATLARSSKLQPKDMQGGTFTVSNIGSVGNASVVAPVIVEGQVAILGVGRSKVVPAFGEKGELVAKEECVLSWSADHRIVDGGTVARCAERVRMLLENPAEMLVQLR